MTVAPAEHDLLITREGYELLRAELDALRTDGRRAMTERLRDARADGTSDDNPGLLDAFEEQAQLERRIAILEERIAMARVVEPSRDGRVAVGSAVRLRDVEADELLEYRLVGTIEANAGEGRVSVEAPVGRALLGAVAGDHVHVACPRGTLRFEVLGVEAA